MKKPEIGDLLLDEFTGEFGIYLGVYKNLMAADHTHRVWWFDDEDISHETGATIERYRRNAERQTALSTGQI